MAYWMVACSVYLYIAILGANARFCRWEDIADCDGYKAGLARATSSDHPYLVP